MGAVQGSMYQWRRWSATQRADALRQRQQRKHPLHSPPHKVSQSTTCHMITAACYEHRPVIRPQSLVQRL